MSTKNRDPQAVLRETFGFDEFRPGQEEIIRALLDKHDVLAVLPTGGGKSLVYQLAAELLPGVTLVVSPLLALMATATPWVRDDIIARLGLRQPRVIVRGTDRPNLFFEVRRVETEAEDRPLLERLLLEDADD